jgi:hypothetical protein
VQVIHTHTVRSSGHAPGRGGSQPQPAGARASMALSHFLGPAVRAAAMLLVAVAAMALAAGHSRAATINVWACHQPDGQTVAPTDRWSSSISEAGIHTQNSCGAGGAGYLEISVDAGVPHSLHSNGFWKFTAPSNTTAVGFSYLRSASVQNRSDFAAFRSDLGLYDSPNIAETCMGCSVPWAWTGWPLANKPGQLLLLEACGGNNGGCDGSSWGWYRIASAQVILEDTSAPTFSTLSGALASGASLRGNASLSFQLADAGVGVYKLHATVDGRSFDDRTLDTNGGKCAPVMPGTRNFNYAVPCPLTFSTSTRLDTSTLLDGQHALLVKAEDAAGNTTTVFNDTIETHNAPALVARPEIAGTAKIGTELSATTGSWSPTPTGYAYQWLRCPSTATVPADADACVTIAGATRATYTPVAADIYGRVMVRVTAGNASGSDSSVSAPSALIADTQGRTTPPPADDGGSRDVVIVPVPPGPGSSSSSTTIITNGPSTTAFPIDGLHNPLAGIPGHVPNGTNATENGRVRVAFELRRRGARKQVMVVRSTRNRRWVIKGRLTNAQGKPIGGGQLVTAWQMPGRREAAHTGVKTRADGRFTYVLPKGPSRAVKFVYFAFSDSTAYGESNVVREKVTTPVKLAVAPLAASNGGSVKFTGAVGTDFIPKDGVLVSLEARYPDGGWKQFKLVRTGRGGRFTATYRFTRTSSTTRYAFRARVAKQAGYPFEGGISRTTGVLVSP